MSVSIKDRYNEIAAILTPTFQDVAARTEYVHISAYNMVIDIIDAFTAKTLGDRTHSSGTELAVFIITAILISPIILLLLMVNILCALTEERQPEPPAYNASDLETVSHRYADDDNGIEPPVCSTK